MRILLLALIILVPTVLHGGVVVTPTEYRVTFYSGEISLDGVNFSSIFEDPAGLEVDLADPNAFATIFGPETTVLAGSYHWIRFTLDRDLVWSYPDPPVNLVDQVFTVVDGPPGPTPDQLTVYFATSTEGGLPPDSGGDGTQAAPFLLSRSADVLAGGNTILRLGFEITDTVGPDGGGGFELAPPRPFILAENASAGALSGDFNACRFNARKTFTGPTVDEWSYLSSSGVLSFDGAGGWSYTGQRNSWDVNAGPATGATGADAASGRYGLNADGSFWMTMNGAEGTLRGAVSQTQSVIVATMFDSATDHFMVYGVREATGASVAGIDGAYAFALYQSQFDDANNELEYLSNFGFVSGDGTGAVNGTQSVNLVEIADPRGTPAYAGPFFQNGYPVNEMLTLSPSGVLGDVTGEIVGGVLGDGSAGYLTTSHATPYDPNTSFGFLVQASPEGTFDNFSLRGTYFGGHFGDRVEVANNSSRFFSGFFAVAFNGASGATVTVLENREGVVEVETLFLTYDVDPVTGEFMFLDSNGETDIAGVIGPNAETLLLYARAEQSPGQANEQRFLGLALKQQ